MAKITLTNGKNFIEFVRLALISHIISVAECHQKLYAIIEQDILADSALLEAVCSQELEIISQCLAQVKGAWDCEEIESLMASEMFIRYTKDAMTMPKITSALYLQLIDRNTKCWHQDFGRIMEFDDGFNLIMQDIGNEQILTKEVLSFLKSKIKSPTG